MLEISEESAAVKQMPTPVENKSIFKMVEKEVALLPSFVPLLQHSCHNQEKNHLIQFLCQDGEKRMELLSNVLCLSKTT